MTVTVPVSKTVELTGVPYDRRAGAKCPKCGLTRARVYSLRAPDQGVQVRYHRCQCCGAVFKSLEEDNSQKRNGKVHKKSVLT